jgi:hypothetical protein
LVQVRAAHERVAKVWRRSDVVVLEADDRDDRGDDVVRALDGRSAATLVVKHGAGLSRRASPGVRPSAAVAGA